MPSIIIMALLHRKFRPYNIFGTRFKIFTDHYSLQLVVPQIEQVTIGTDGSACGGKSA